MPRCPRLRLRTTRSCLFGLPNSRRTSPSTSSSSVRHGKSERTHSSRSGSTSTPTSRLSRRKSPNTRIGATLAPSNHTTMPPTRSRRSWTSVLRILRTLTSRRMHSNGTSHNTLRRTKSPLLSTRTQSCTVLLLTFAPTAKHGSTVRSTMLTPKRLKTFQTRSGGDSTSLRRGFRRRRWRNKSRQPSRAKSTTSRLSFRSARRCATRAFATAIGMPCLRSVGYSSSLQKTQRCSHTWTLVSTSTSSVSTSFPKALPRSTRSKRRCQR
mmetsp:Transcript_24998/g.75327  ORF Transcript_24998/g.75327 Transcript_24998/m.75327 type:complete len:267 (+) Transcript_24998:1876-2676(+)